MNVTLNTSFVFIRSIQMTYEMETCGDNGASPSALETSIKYVILG